MYTLIMYIDHFVHELKAGSGKIVRLFQREKVGENYHFVPVAWRCSYRNSILSQLQEKGSDKRRMAL